MSERMCVTCAARPSGRYLNCKSCRFKAEKNSCPECGDVKTARAKRCQPCNNTLRGPDHPAWRGGIVLDKHGYVREFAPDHPRANMGRYVKQHHLVMEQELGRYLLEGESVHHKNGNRQDNRIENLELWRVGQPAGQRVADQVAWAKQILALYPEFAETRD